MELQRHQNAPAEDISEWVLFTGVDKSTLVRDFLEPSTPWTDAGWSSFDASQGLLLASTPNSRSRPQIRPRRPAKRYVRGRG